MHTRHVASIVCTAVAITCVGPSLSAQDKLVFVPVRASEVMTQAQLEQTGVAGLTPQQRLMFDAFLTRYTAELRAAIGASAQAGGRIAAARHGGTALSDDGGSDEAETAEPAQGRRGREWVPPFTAPVGARLAANPDDGNYVRLADGTLWEVYVPDRTATVVWRPGDYIVVSLAPTAVNDYDFLLVNASDRTRALVRFVDVVGPRRR